MGDWYLEALQNFLNSAEWRDTIRIYVDAHCQYFIQITEYHPQQFVIWKNFQEIAENVLDNALQMVGGSMDLLEKALDDVKHRPSRGPRDEIIKDVIDQLLSFESFDTFALMMNQSCMEKLNDEGKGDVEDCDCHTLMRMGFTVNNINHAYDEVGQTATLEDLLLYLTHKQSADNAGSGDNSYKATPSNTSQKKSLKVRTHQDDYVDDLLITDEEVYRSHQRYVSPLDKFIVEAKDTYNLNINLNELNAKFAIAESVLSNYQDTVLHQQQQQTSGDANNDQLLALTRWAAEMKSLQGDIFTAYNEDIPCQDLCFNSPKGLIGWYLELEELRHEINESYKTNPSSSGLSSGTAGASIISDNELQRMAELDKIAAMGTEDEQRLHSLLSRHEMIRKEILQLYHKCNILINTNKDIKRNMIEEVYLLLKEKVKKLNKMNNNVNHDEQMINEEAIWEDPIIQEMIHHEHGLEIIHQLLELHILEDEQHMIKVEIHQLIGSPSAASAASFANDFKEGSGGSDDKKSDSRGFADAMSGVSHLDELFNFDAKLLDEANAPLSFADAKESKASASALSPSGHTNVVSAAIEKKADFPAAKETAESKMPSAPSALPPILTPNKRLMEKNPNNEVIDLLKNQHRQALQSLKDSLSLLKQQKLSNLENRLLLKKKLLANARASTFDENNKMSSEENTLFIQNEEKDINQLENEIYQQQIAFNSLENSMVDGFKSRCIYELKTAKTFLDQENNNSTGRNKDAKDAISASEQLVALTEKIQLHLRGKERSNEESDAAASELAKSILEKYEKDKAYLMQNLQQQRLKQYQKLQKRLQSKLQKQPSSAANDVEQQEQYEKQMKQIDQQYEEEVQSTLQSLQESLFMTLAGSELQTPVLLSSLTAANKSNDHLLSDDYLQSEEEKMMSQHSPTISYLNSLDHLKSKYLQASNQLFQSLQHSKIHQNESLQRRRRQLTSSSTPQENKELLEQEAILQNEILEVVDHVILDAYTSHLDEMIEEKKAKLEDDDRRFRYKSLSDKMKKQRNGKPIDNNNENDDELNERMKIGLLNSYEKSKQSYDLRKKEQQLSGKDHLQKRLEQRRAGRGNDANSSPIWEDVQTENVIESFMDKFLSQPSPSRSSLPSLSPDKKSQKPMQNDTPLVSVSKDGNQDSRKGNDAKAAWNAAESNNNKSAEDTSRIKAIHQEKEKELVSKITLPPCFMFFSNFSLFRWIICIVIC